MQNGRLDSWKSIATHFGRSVRTVQRWHDQYSLPVHRVGGMRGSVYAYAKELDDWLLVHSAQLETPTGVSLKDPCAGLPCADGTQGPVDRLWSICSEDALGEIAKQYREAILRDPSDGEAYEGAGRISLLSGFLGFLGPITAANRARSMFSAALQIAPSNKNALSELACLNMLSARTWENGRKQLQSFLDRGLRPDVLQPYMVLLYILENNLGAAEELAHSIHRGNTLTCVGTWLYAWTLYLQTKFLLVLDVCSQARFSGELGYLLAGVEALAMCQYANETAENERLAELARTYPHSLIVHAAQGIAYCKTGRTADASLVYEQIAYYAAHRGGSAYYPLMLVATALERYSLASKHLECSRTAWDLPSLCVGRDPALRFLRNDSRLKEEIVRIGLQPYSDADNSETMSFDSKAVFTVS